MNDTAISNSGHQFSSLGALKTAARHESPEALKETAKLFEAQFIQMLFKTMRASSIGDEMFGSEQTKFYQEMYDKEIANTLAEKGQMGFADLLVKQLSRQQNTNATSVLENNAVPINTSVIEAPKTVTEKIDSFIDDVFSAAQAAAKKLGISPQILIAQSALETGWGQHIPDKGDGNSSHNFFGIKADSRWNGDKTSQQTQEFNGQFLHTVQDDFRSYDSAQKSFNDYADFILNNPRYSDLPHSEPKDYVQKLQTQGYATDPEYAKKLNQIMNNPHFIEKIATLTPQDLHLADDI